MLLYLVKKFAVCACALSARTRWQVNTRTLDRFIHWYQHIQQLFSTGLPRGMIWMESPGSLQSL